MNHDLIDFLLNALDDHECEEWRNRLHGDDCACRQAEQLRRALAPLQGDLESAPPPLGLAARTCEQVQAVRRAN